MSDARPTLILASRADRARAIQWIDAAPVNSRVTFQRPRRSLPQNDRLHAMITDIATQKLYHGLRLSVADWKLIFMDALNRELRIVPNLDGTGFVNLGRSTSQLDKADFSDLMELVTAWGLQNGVTFHEPASESPARDGSTPQTTSPAAQEPAEQSVEPVLS